MNNNNNNINILLLNNSVYKGLPEDLTISSGITAALGFAQLEVFQVEEFPDYHFSTLSAGFSFGVGMAFIQEGSIQFNHKPNLLEKLRESSGINWLCTVQSPVIAFVWFLCYVFVGSSPVLVLLFD